MDWKKGVWCYTTDPSTEWDNCEVPDCGQLLLYTCQVNLYRS